MFSLPSSTTRLVKRRTQVHALGHVVGEDLGAGGGADAGGLVQVFEREGDAVQRSPGPARGQAGLGLPGFGQSPLRQEGDEGVEPAVQRLDAFQAGAGELKRR
jgi:hypothetical protein